MFSLKEFYVILFGKQIKLDDKNITQFFFTIDSLIAQLLKFKITQYG